MRLDFLRPEWIGYPPDDALSMFIGTQAYYYNITQQIETIARCLLPDIVAFYHSEEGQREFAELKAQRAKKSAKGLKPTESN